MITGERRHPEVHIIQTTVKNWRLLALCGAFDANYSVMNFFVQRPDGLLPHVP
jgi:hypothetical protein